MACAATSCAAPTAARTWQSVTTGVQVGLTASTLDDARPHRAGQPGRPPAGQYRRRRDLRPVKLNARSRPPPCGQAPAGSSWPARAACKPSTCPEARHPGDRMHVAAAHRPRRRIAGIAGAVRPAIAARGSNGWSSTTAWRCWCSARCITLVLAVLAVTKLTLSASFEKMIPRSHPYIQNYLDNRAELRGLGNALRIVVENPKGDIYDPQYLDDAQEDPRRAIPHAGRGPGLGEVAVGAGRALDRSHRGGLPGRPGDAGQLRRLAHAPPSSCAATSRAPASSAAW